MDTNKKFKEIIKEIIETDKQVIIYIDTLNLSADDIEINK